MRKIKNVLSAVLSVTLVVTGVTITPKKNAVVAENANVSLESWVDVSALNTKDTVYGLYNDGTTQKTAQAVWFGKNKVSGAAQKWWIAGYDEKTGGLALMCDPTQPIVSKMQFHPSWWDKRTLNKEDLDNLGITYLGMSDDFEGALEVHSRHYGCSTNMRNGILKSLATDTEVFSASEQSMMKPTKIYTADMDNVFNSNVSPFYYTADKLYLATGVRDAQEVYIGANTVDADQDNINTATANGLPVGLTQSCAPINSPYSSEYDQAYADGEWIWMRSPDHYYLSYMSVFSIVPQSGQHVGYTACDQDKGYVVPALALDTDSIAFASTAVAGTSDAELTDTMTFRHTDNTGRVDAAFGYLSDAIGVIKGGDKVKDYLYVQGNDGAQDWVYSTEITADTTIHYDSIYPGLTNLDNCKVWIESAVNNVVYAKQDTVPLYTITYDLDGGKETTNPSFYSSAGAPIELSEPTRSGYVFKGWKIGETDTLEMNPTIPTGDSGNKLYVAVWEKIITEPELYRYLITYFLEEGVQNPNPIAYTTADTIRLEEPQRAGYEFLGWIGTDLSEPTKDVVIPAGSRGDRTYRMVWKKVESGTSRIEETKEKDAIDFYPPQLNKKQVKVSVRKAKVTLSWKKLKAVTGYTVQYSTSRNFKKKKTKSTPKPLVKLKKLKVGKKYYFRIKAYRYQNGKKLYAKKWSKVIVRKVK